MIADRVTVQAAAERLNVTAGLIRKWVERYQVKPYQDGRFAFSDLARIERQTRTRRGRSKMGIGARVTFPANPMLPDLEAVEDAAFWDLVDTHPGAQLIREAYANNPGIDLQPHLATLATYGFDPRDPDVIQRAIDHCLGDANRVRPVRARPVDPAAVVYYMRMDTRIKIGTTKSLQQRLQQIAPEELVTAEIGDSRLEHLRHREFAKLRIGGEWFRMEEPLLVHMRSLASRFKEDFGMTLVEYTNGHRLVTGLTCETSRSRI